MVTMKHVTDCSCSVEWLRIGASLLMCGRPVEPRGKLTYELPQQTVTISLRRPVLTVPERKLNYQFMAAEAFWILSGDDRVETIVPYNKHIGAFSDDGQTFAGAYGPRIQEQLSYVVGKLMEDPDSRQAGLTIWRPNPAHSADIPCTVAIWFQIRSGKLNVHVFMRSSDVWLGLPYDLFNFSVLGHLVCARLRSCLFHQDLEPGQLFLTAASAHLYELNREALKHAVEEWDPVTQIPTPEWMFTDEVRLMETLDKLRTSKAGDALRWWL